MFKSDPRKSQPVNIHLALKGNAILISRLKMCFWYPYNIYNIHPVLTSLQLKSNECASEKSAFQAQMPTWKGGG